MNETEDTHDAGSLLLEGGRLVTASDSFEADLLIRGDAIAAVGHADRNLVVPDHAQRIDVSGKWILPGGIDTHVHLEHPIDRIGIETADDFFSGSIAAACGGTTTIVDFALQREGDDLEDVASARRELAASKSIVDFGLHVILTDVRPETPSQIRWAIDHGFSSFKIYMTYADKHVDDASLLRILETNAAHGGLTYLHCENDCAVTHLIHSFLEEGDSGARFHAPSRPPLVEAEATYRALCLAELMGASVCIAHVTSKRALENIVGARRRGVQAVSETCPQYLLLNESCYDHPEASKFVCTPPMRSDEHRAALWEAVARGDIQQVASDHAPFRFQDQKQGAENFTKIPNGLPGIETRLPLLFSEGVSSGRLSPSRFVQLTASNPAKMFGLYPQKGSLNIGADADLVVFDPSARGVVRHEDLHHRVDYSPFEGMELIGVPVMTVSRGRVVATDGTLADDAEKLRGSGRFVARRPIEPSDDFAGLY